MACWREGAAAPSLFLPWGGHRPPQLWWPPAIRRRPANSSGQGASSPLCRVVRERGCCPPAPCSLSPWIWNSLSLSPAFHPLSPLRFTLSLSLRFSLSHSLRFSLSLSLQNPSLSLGHSLSLSLVDFLSLLSSLSLSLFLVPLPVRLLYLDMTLSEPATPFGLGPCSSSSARLRTGHSFWIVAAFFCVDTT